MPSIHSRHIAVRWLTLAALAISCVSASPLVADDAASAKIKELQKERLATVRDMAAEVKARFKNREATSDELLQATRLQLGAELDACETAKDRVAVLERFVREAKETEHFADQMAKTGQSRNSTALAAKAERLRIEIALERARANAAAKPK